MNKFSILLLCIALLLGCVSNKSVNQNNQDTHVDYFSDATNCSESTQPKQAINVPTGRTQSQVQIPAGRDKNAYVDCMKQKGWSVLRADPTEYQAVTKACHQQAQGAKDFDESYADCVSRSRLNVEVITDK